MQPTRAGDLKTYQTKGGNITTYINQWLRENPEAEVINIEHTSLGDDRFSVLILYRD